MGVEAAGIRPPALKENDPDEALARSIIAKIAGARPLQTVTGPIPRRHEIAPPTAWPWLPTLEDGHLAPHPYCAVCGGVKYVGTFRAIPLGGLINRASRLARILEVAGRKVTEAQMRLIVKKLEAEEAGDAFTNSRDTQETLLVETFNQFTGAGRTALWTMLRHC